MRAALIPTLALTLALTACHSGNPRAAPPPPASTTVTTQSSVSTTAGAQTSGLRTVLSPVGLNIRAQPAKAAAILGRVAQATMLTVLAHTDQGGGWFQVKGSTVTGWISDNRTLTAPGKFNAYSSSQHQFEALYPEAWTSAELAPASVVFHPPSGRDTVVVTTAMTVGQLSRGRAGYHQTSDEQVVVCGVTGDLVGYTQSTPPPSSATSASGVVPERYLTQVHLTLDAQHALGIDANLDDSAQLQTARDFVSSVKFPFPKCQQ